MNEPIDIKTKKSIAGVYNNKFKKSLVLASLEENILTHWDTWGKFQQAWTNRAYQKFRDLDKYIVLIYLIRDNWESLTSKFQYLSMDAFYDSENVTIDKINLIKISNDLNIPKETIRRKVNELQTSDILKRDGKSIVFNRKGIETQKPTDMIELLSTFIDKKSSMLRGKDWFGDSISREYTKKFIKKYFTVVWLRFFKMQIPFLIRHRQVFGDLETWIVWGNIALSHQYHLAKAAEKNLITSPITLKSYYSDVAEVRIARGINASSIADISRIPRATVIRKLKWLVEQNCIKKNKNLEYQMKKGGKLNKLISDNFLINQHAVAEFLTDIFDLIKNSEFKL